jgi:hypothetical protein
MTPSLRRFMAAFTLSAVFALTVDTSDPFLWWLGAFVVLSLAFDVVAWAMARRLEDQR